MNRVNWLRVYVNRDFGSYVANTEGILQKCMHYHCELNPDISVSAWNYIQMFRNLYLIEIQN
jgi:hypothetical protein